MTLTTKRTQPSLYPHREDNRNCAQNQDWNLHVGEQGNAGKETELEPGVVNAAQPCSCSSSGGLQEL